MKILLVSLLKRAVTPQMTASRPRVIYELATGLLAKGHEVTIIGTGDSQVDGATIIPVIPQGFTTLPPFENPFYAEVSYLVQLAKKVEEIAHDYDIIHNHTYPELFNLFAQERIQTPMVTTIHAQATPELDSALACFHDSNLVALSKAHKASFTKATIKDIVYNGIDTQLYSLQEQKGEYLLWIGRLSKAKNNEGEFQDPKGVKWAIELARSTNTPLKLSGNVEDRTFYDQEIKPYLSETIQWVGEVSSEQPLKKEEVVSLMQGARAFLMPINWEEPFGLVMAEAMSCGTPVIGFNRGAVAELVKDGETGFIVESEAGIDGLAKAVERVNSIDPKACREHVVSKFSITKTCCRF